MAAQARLAAGGVAYERLKMERPTITATVVLGFGGLALIVAFGAIWLGLYLSRRFTAPLVALAATTQRIAGGESLETVPLPAEDEVGMLLGSFNSMVQRLSQRENELKSAVHRLDAVLGAVRTGVLTLDAQREHVAGNPAAAASARVEASGATIASRRLRCCASRARSRKLIRLVAIRDPAGNTSTTARSRVPRIRAAADVISSSMSR